MKDSLEKKIFFMFKETRLSNYFVYLYFSCASSSRNYIYYVNYSSNIIIFFRLIFDNIVLYANLSQNISPNLIPNPNLLAICVN